MTGHSEETAPDKSRPEGVGLAQAEGEVEDGELTGGCRHGVNRVPASRNAMTQQDDADDGPGNIQRHLHHVGPDDGGHSAFEGIDQGEDANNGDRSYIPGTNRYPHHNGNGEDTDAFSRGA